MDTLENQRKGFAQRSNSLKISGCQSLRYRNIFPRTSIYLAPTLQQFSGAISAPKPFDIILSLQMQYFKPQTNMKKRQEWAASNPRCPSFSPLSLSRHLRSSFHCRLPDKSWRFWPAWTSIPCSYLAKGSQPWIVIPVVPYKAAAEVSKIGNL